VGASDAHRLSELGVDAAAEGQTLASPGRHVVQNQLDFGVASILLLA
jgi:hypothetical protein